MADRTGADLDANPHNRAIKTYTGYVFDIFDESTWHFERMDIARALSNLCRFAGHIDFRSVASHSIEVASILKDWGASEDVQLLGLLHDASEAYLLDIPRPWKGEVRIGSETYYQVEERIEDAIFRWAGPAVLNARYSDWDFVKEADMESYRRERDSRAAPTGPTITPNAGMNVFLMNWDYLDEQIAENPLIAS